MPHRLIESESYQRARESLSPNARVALPYALERIADNPSDLYRRRPRPEGTYVDSGAVGLLIDHVILDAERVRLLDVIDIKKEHRWP
jgi:hypothetical protein